MKITRNLILALVLLTVAPLAASAQISVSAGINIGSGGQASVDLGFFYDNLASYGNWIQRPNYGWVWTPRQVDNGWRPYQDGRWVWTDQGWTWISDEPYGWATYHYGRWYDDQDLGWSWVPGDEWGPAWVDWQEGDDYIGWAPLPPSASISVNIGGGGYGLGPEAYVFVPERNFLADRIVTYVVPQQRVVGFWGRTRNYTNYRVTNNIVINQGIPVDRIQRAVGRAVPRYQMANINANDARQRTARISGNQVQIFRPQVRQNAQVAPPASRPAARNSVVTAAQFQQRNPNRANRAARAPQVQGGNPTIQGQGQRPQPSVQGQQPSSNRGKTWNQVQAERRQRQPNNNQADRPSTNQPRVQPSDNQPRVQPSNNGNPRNRTPQPQAQPERQRRNDNNPTLQAQPQPRNPQREPAQREREQTQRPPQRPQESPKVQPEPNRGNPNPGNPGVQAPKNNNDNQRGKAQPKPKDQPKDRNNRDRDNQNPPPPGG